MRHSFYPMILRESTPDVLYVVLSSQFDKCLLEEHYNLSIMEFFFFSEDIWWTHYFYFFNTPSLVISLLSTQCGPGWPSLTMSHKLWPLFLTQGWFVTQTEPIIKLHLLRDNTRGIFPGIASWLLEEAISLYLYIIQLKRGKPELASGYLTHIVKETFISKKWEFRRRCKERSLTIFLGSMGLIEHLADCSGHLLVNQWNSVPAWDCLNCFPTLKWFSLF